MQQHKRIGENQSSEGGIREVKGKKKKPGEMEEEDFPLGSFEPGVGEGVGGWAREE